MRIIEKGYAPYKDIWASPVGVSHYRSDLSDKKDHRPAGLQYTLFELIEKETTEPRCEVFPMHLDLDIEGTHVRFADMKKSFMDGRTEYQLRIVQEDKNGRLYITDPRVPEYSENALREYAMEHANRKRRSPENSIDQTDRIPAPDKH